MTKKELLKDLEGLDDDAIIFVYVNEDEKYYHIKSTDDKVAGVKMQNEITLICD